MAAVCSIDNKASCTCMVVKWNSPIEELSGIAQLAASDTQRRLCRASDMRLVVPSVNWGMQLQHICETQEIPALFCAPHARLGSKDRKRIAILSALANPHDSAAQQACIAAGVTPEELDTLLSKYAQTHGYTLMKAIDLKGSMALRHVTLHVRGDENPQELYELVRTQIERPTFPAKTETLPIVLMGHIHSHVKRIFAVGCVDGLVPSYAANMDEKERHAAREAGRASFESCFSHAEDSVVISYFTRIEEHVAQMAGIVFGRTKLQDGTRLAMTRPTPYLAEWGANLPSTVGGQALLRERGLN